MIDSVRTWSLLRELRASRSPDQLAALQDDLLREAVARAAELPFYRRFWDAHGFDATGFGGLEDLQRIPISSKEHARELFSSDAGAARFHTSGSSGSRLGVPRGSVEQRLWRASGLAAWLEHGYRWSDVTLRFDSQAAPSHPLQRVGISRTVWVPVELSPDEHVRRLQEVRPDVVVGTPTILRGVCKAWNDSPPRPRIVFSQGEVLDAGTRATIERVFEASPVDLYGLTELGYVAWQCELRDALHVNTAAFLVEVLRDERPAAPGELGRVLVTDLRGRLMPLLRYDTGDLALAADRPCACGRSAQLLGRIEGRSAATIEHGDGSLLTTRTLVDALGGALPPDRYAVSQDRAGRVSFDVAPGEVAGRAAANLVALVGRDVSISRTFRPAQGVEKSHPVRSTKPLEFR